MNSPDPASTFLLEAEDLLTQIEEIALEAGRQTADAEAINRLFRAFHTIKGSGAMFGFDAVAAFTHHVETALDQVREGVLVLDTALLELILAARDQIEVLLREPADAAAGRECARIVAALKTVSGAVAPGVTPAAPARPVAKVMDAAETPVAWKVFFRPSPGIALCGMDPLSLLNELRSLGECEIAADTAGIPPLDKISPEQCHLAWRITLTTDRGVNAIKDVFIFLDDESRMTIEPVSPSAGPSPGLPPAGDAPRKPDPLAPAASAKKSAAKEATVRVPSSKLDRLVNLVGEFVMNQSRLAQVAARSDNPDLACPVEAIERLVAELRDSVLGIRMMPIGSTFNHFKRLVHDLSLELGKEIDLVTEGAETELDKTVLDQLGDPLVHLIRNCIDHGIAPPDERLRIGKSRRGTIRLTATHEGSHVVIAIQDDGRGMDVDAIRAKAVEKGLITETATLSEKELFNLVFLPGFSTAKQITSVSGRGVGMDVVRKQIDALSGGIQLVSQRGVGTTISLTLPLTLAIIDGLLVELAGDQFILPMSAVTENVELPRVDRERQNGRNVIAVRGELIPYIRLRELFGLGGEGPVMEKIVIASQGDQRVGIVVDRVLGSHQTVIQSLGRFYRDIEVCSGSTIMGDGRVALILDLAGLIARVDRAGPGAPAALQTPS